MTGAFPNDDALAVHDTVGQPLPDVAESPRVDAPHGSLLLDDTDDMPQDRILSPTVVHEIEVTHQDELATRTAERHVQQARCRVDVPVLQIAPCQCRHGPLWFSVGQREDDDVHLRPLVAVDLSLIHISEPTRLGMISYAV